jgi:hypothetical protein
MGDGWPPIFIYDEDEDKSELTTDKDSEQDSE